MIMQTELHFNVYICKCGNLSKTLENFNEHKKDGCMLSRIRHIVYDSKLDIKHRIDIRMGASDIGNE